MFEKLEIIGSSNSQKVKFSKAANNLLNHCFILKKKEDTRLDYIFIKDNRDQFALVFDLLGYDIRIDEDIGLMSYYLDVKKINAFHSNKAITTIKYHNQEQLKAIFAEPDISKHLGRRDRFFMIFAYESG